MVLYLFVTSGPQNGAFFYLRNGAVIGRKENADIWIDSKTISSRHAQVEKTSEGFYLNSLSRKGILIDGCACEKIELGPGVSFLLGNTSFCVKDKIEGLPSWKGLLLITFNQLAKAKHINQIKPKKVFPFKSRLKLKIIQGRQKGTQWCIGYGPRYVGTDSVDLPIYEPQVGPCGFYLEPLLKTDEEQGIAFFTKQRNIVHVNGKPIESKSLNTGDVIQIAGTCIRVRIENIE